MIKSDMVNGHRKCLPFEAGANSMQHQNTIVKIPQLGARASQPINAPFMKCAAAVQRGAPIHLRRV